MPPREILEHRVNLEDRQPTLMAMGRVGVGGAEQLYRIRFKRQNGEDALLPVPFVSLEHEGVTNEVLLAIVIDRLEAFQRGKFACAANANALSFCNMALTALKGRTIERMARGVEGKAEE